MSKSAKGKIPINKLAKAIASVATTESDYPSPIKDNDNRKWKAQDALRDIQRAEEHRKDKSLMSDVKRLAKEQMTNLKKIC